MQPFNLFKSFIPALARGRHKLDTDTLTLYLSKNAPRETAELLSDITATDTKYCSSRTLKTKLTDKDGVVSLYVAPITLKATGTVGPFQYLIIANGINLIGWADRGKLQTLDANDGIDLNFGEVSITIGETI